MLTTHKKASIFGLFLVLQIFILFLVLQIFVLFHAYGFESGKDTRYKVSLVGVLPQSCFRLTAVVRGYTLSNGSKPSTPPAAVAASAPWRGSSHRCVTAMLGWSGCAGSMTPRCHWPRP
jgi:hypothetical protein